MGDEAAVFTDEELVILGEKEPVSTAVQDTQVKTDETKTATDETKTVVDETKTVTDEQPEHTDEEKSAAEKMGLRIDGGFIVDDDGTKIPAKRWKSLYRDYKETERGKEETERKFNLFRELGADKFYEIYPEDKPAGYKPATREEKQPDIGNIGAMVVQGGPYNGQTLNEVYAVDPAYANTLQQTYLNGQREAEVTQRQSREALKQESEQEIQSFSDRLATELFGKKATAELSDDESTKVAQTIQQTLDWMAKTKRGAGVILDAYFLMNRENIVKRAREEGGKTALASLQKPAIPSIDTGAGKSVAGSDYEAMTGDQLAAKIADMSEAQYAKFMKDASPALRAKYPGLPWD